MTSFFAKGTDIARALDNALLFCDAKAEYLPGIVHVEFSAGGIAFSACDDYATGRDRVGEVTLATADARFQMAEADADAVVKFARSARTKSVVLELSDEKLSITIGDEVEAYYVAKAFHPWDDILPLIDVDAHESAGLPHTVAFNAARFARFGRVKALKDAPMDIRFYRGPSAEAPVALVKIGPTFRGEIQGVRREAAMKHLGPEAMECFWNGGPCTMA